jgi:hypothetical protein
VVSQVSEARPGAPNHLMSNLDVGHPPTFSVGRAALQSLQQFRERCLQSRGDLAEGSQSRLACTALQVRNMHFVDAGLFGKVDLPPIPGAAQFPDPLARRRTDVLCHASMIGLAFALYLAHTLFWRKRYRNHRHGNGVARWFCDFRKGMRLIERQRKRR